MNNYEKAQKEYEELIEWVIEEEEKVTKHLKETGRYIGGLDTQREEYQHIYEERNRRIKEIKKKYQINTEK